jgi:DNA-binding response OmpR family regulator
MISVAGAQPLSGANILIVEDEAILALDLASTIRDEGASVKGPLHRLDQAMAYDDLDEVDAAILDVDIDGAEVFAFADRLKACRIPIVFHTGRIDLSDLRAEYPEARIVRKPSTAVRIVMTVASAIARIAPGPGQVAAP